MLARDSRRVAAQDVQLSAIKVSARMVAAGLRVLRESGALAGELSSDAMLVREILEVALLAHWRETERQRLKTNHELLVRWTRETKRKLDAAS